MKIKGLSEGIEGLDGREGLLVSLDLMDQQKAQEIYALGVSFCEAFLNGIDISTSTFWALSKGLEISGLAEKYYVSALRIDFKPGDCLGEIEGYVIRRKSGLFNEPKTGR